MTNFYVLRDNSGKHVDRYFEDAFNAINALIIEAKEDDAAILMGMYKDLINNRAIRVGHFVIYHVETED